MPQYDVALQGRQRAIAGLGVLQCLAGMIKAVQTTGARLCDTPVVVEEVVEERTACKLLKAMSKPKSPGNDERIISNGYRMIGKAGVMMAQVTYRIVIR